MNGRKIRLTAVNDMDPGPQPQELKFLSFVEKLLIARIHPMITLYLVRGGQRRYSGNVISFNQDIQQLTKALILPHNPQSLSSIVMVVKETPSGLRRFRVRRNYVIRALEWLVQHNEFYRDVIIDRDVLASLPDDDCDIASVVNQVRLISEEQLPDEVEDTDHPHFPASYVPHDIQIRTEEGVRRRVQCVPYPQLDSLPVNEFTTEGFLSMSFPWLFPSGSCCLNNRSRQYRVTDLDFFRHLLKYHDGRFAKDPLFSFYAHNFLRRREALKLGRVYVKKNALDSMTVSQLQQLIRTDRHWIKKVLYWTHTLPGSNAFWFRCYGDLTAMIETIGMPTIFFTFSSADLQNPDLFQVLKDYDNIYGYDLSQRTLVNNNPMIADWFFYRRSTLR